MLRTAGCHFICLWDFNCFCVPLKVIRKQMLVLIANVCAWKNRKVLQGVGQNSATDPSRLSFAGISVVAQRCCRFITWHLLLSILTVGTTSAAPTTTASAPTGSAATTGTTRLRPLFRFLQHLTALSTTENLFELFVPNCMCLLAKCWLLQLNVWCNEQVWTIYLVIESQTLCFVFSRG
jgi:hypothetical protein